MVPLEQRIEELEMKLAFQESTIEALDQQVIKLNAIVDEQQEKLRILVDKVQQSEPSNMANPADETPPPHY
ncbi:SlyX family protein [Shewanella algidipiscicola]|uniref:Protein SlyX homolog n=1 Tax=Shewanella algidipiscicola TaxID=614070 RepID=A0ABQ4PAH0_9GAMM|nr:SlyX family protein [Shewanella algidipiscicola]GIU44469.1 protein SlyX [Shewanella algidipiscicola]